MRSFNWSSESEPNFFREFVIDRHFIGCFDLFHLDVELRFLAGQIGRAVIRGECDVYCALLSGAHTNKLILKSRNKRIAAQASA